MNITGFDIDNQKIELEKVRYLRKIAIELTRLRTLKEIELKDELKGSTTTIFNSDKEFERDG